MDFEFEISYRNLMVHHLEWKELEYELTIRGIRFALAEPRSALQRKLREVLKKERENEQDIDVSRWEKSIDDEIELIDANLKPIKELLESRKRLVVNKESLKTRLVHYFMRLRRIQQDLDKEEDCADTDKLVCVIRKLMNDYFSQFSTIPEIRQEVSEQIAETLSKLNLLAAQPNTPLLGNQVGQEEDEEEEEPEEEATDSSMVHRRKLLSLQKPKKQTSAPPKFPQVFSQYPFAYPQYPQFAWQQQNSWQPQNVMMNQPTMPIYPFGFPQYPQYPPYPPYGWPPQGPSKDQIKERNKEKVIRKTRLNTPSPKKDPPSRSTDSDQSSGSHDLGSVSDQSDRRGRSRHRRRMNHKSRPVSEWKLCYDGKDNGQDLMSFIREVEFYAKSEHMSRSELFRSAIYLFKGQAKSWFMSGVENEDFMTWEELVFELKREFLNPDHDHVSEAKVMARKQGPKEKFQDYLNEMQKMFNALTKPISESRKFEIVYRNTRSDYKGHAVAANIDNLADLKKFGRQLDSTYWYKYTNLDSNNQSRSRSQVNEVRFKPRIDSNNKPKEKPYKSRNVYPSSTKTDASEEEIAKKPPRDSTKSTKSVDKKNEEGQGLEILVRNYKPPKEGICFNCRLQGHHQMECERPLHKYCHKCGFHNFETKNCPWCAKNSQ